MDRLSVEFRDFWPGFDSRSNPFIRALQTRFDVAVVPDAEVCFFSSFGTSHESANAIKIQIIGECMRPDLQWADRAVCFDHSGDPRVLRYPLWCWDIETEALRRPFDVGRPFAEREFCAFIVNNPHGQERNAFFQELSRHQLVHSGGPVFRNCPGPSDRHDHDWRQAKIDWLGNYKFTIAFENQSFAGYTTEKLVDPFLAGSVPIYFGDPLVDYDFAPGSYLNLASFGSIRRLAEAVVELSTDEQTWNSMRAQAPLGELEYERTADPRRLEVFLEDAVLQGRNPATSEGRRARSIVGRRREASRAAGELPRRVLRAARSKAMRT